MFVMTRPVVQKDHYMGIYRVLVSLNFSVYYDYVINDSTEIPDMHLHKGNE